jgi:hypothetical protein
MRTMPKLLGAALLSLSLTVIPLTFPASAQTTGADTTPQTEQDRDFDWGWLGLLGLIGLAGFAGKGSATHHANDSRELHSPTSDTGNRADSTYYQDPNQPDPGSAPRYRDPNETDPSSPNRY